MSTSVRELVSLSSRVLASHDQSDFIWGHASARDADGRGVWIKASGWGLDEITPDRVHLLSEDGDVLDGTGAPHLEYPIHTEIMAARSDVGGVVHSHSPYAVALAAAGHDLLPVSHAGNFFAGTPITKFTVTSDLIITRELGKELASCLGDGLAVFLVNHGIVTVGPDLRAATVAAVVLEQAARQQYLVHGFGGTPRWTPHRESLSKKEHIYHPAAIESVWNYLVRRLPRQHR